MTRRIDTFGEGIYPMGHFYLKSKTGVRLNKIHYGL